MKHLLNMLFVTLVVFQMQSQEQTISGIVTGADDGYPLPGVNVIVKGTSTGTQTDFDGKYQIQATEGEILVFSYVGYDTKNVKVGKSRVVNVALESGSMLDEVVVSGYSSSVKNKAKVYIRGAASVSKSEKSTAKTYGARSSVTEPQSGQLTAGEINDNEKWDEWLKVLKGKKLNTNWGFYTESKIEVLVNDINNNPLGNIKVTLYNSANEIIMVARTDVFGKAILFKNLNSQNVSDFYTIQVIQNNSVYGEKITNQKEVVFTLEEKNVEYNVENNVEVMFTIDATGSMGDEMNYLKSELKNIISRLDKRINQKRVALTFYRDFGDEYVVRDFDFDTNIDRVKANLSNQNANGGGDYEEAVEEALKASLSKSWNVKAKAKLLFLLLDAPPHYNDKNVEVLQKQIKLAQKMGIKIIPIVASGANKDLEFLMRFFSVSTNGTYVFLTDDSGIGETHLKPSADDYKVEKLNDLIVRLIEKYSGVTG